MLTTQGPLARSGGVYPYREIRTSIINVLTRDIPATASWTTHAIALIFLVTTEPKWPVTVCLLTVWLASGVSCVLNAYGLKADSLTADTFWGIFLVHELGHVWNGLADDTNNTPASIANTQTVINDCFGGLNK